MMVKTNLGIYKEESHQNKGVSERCHRIFTISDGSMSKKDAIEMGFGLLLAQRDELVEYVKTLKVLAIYLAGSTGIHPEKLSAKFFKRAEQHFPEYMRKEMDVGIEE
jgi:hypothetical protein